jgi:DUF3027 family protein
MEPKKFLKGDEKHAHMTHKRWLEKYPVNRDMASPSYKDEWYFEQCLRCQFYVTLMGLFESDWGVCSNPASYLDGRVMFEHDGCEFFSFAEDEFSF